MTTILVRVIKTDFLKLEMLRKLILLTLLLKVAQYPFIRRILGKRSEQPTGFTILCLNPLMKYKGYSMHGIRNSLRLWKKSTIAVFENVYLFNDLF